MLNIVQIIPDERDVWGFDADSPSFGPAPTALLEGFAQFPDQVDVHVVSCIRRPLPAPEILSGNIHYHAVPVSGGYRRSLFMEALSKVRKTLREINPDVVHGQGTEDYPGICAALSGVPNCITIHGNMRRVARRLNYRPFPAMAITALTESVALKKTDAVICNSAYTEQCVGKLNKNKIRIPNAVRSSFFDLAARRISPMPHAPCPMSADKPVLLCIGDILPYKNQIGLMKALDSLPDIANMTLLFAGRCDSCSAYGRKFLEMVDARMWCQYAGYLPLCELQKRMAGCAGVVHPSLEDSFGLAVAEAQAARVPVAASAVGGIPDLIQEGQTGWHFDPANPAGICSAVCGLMNALNAAEVSRTAHGFARTKYAPKGIAFKHLALYRLIKNKQ
jgi:glycosyltransferase involved in cell wall biosynthesis